MSNSLKNPYYPAVSLQQPHAPAINVSASIINPDKSQRVKFKDYLIYTHADALLLWFQRLSRPHIVGKCHLVDVNGAADTDTATMWLDCCRIKHPFKNLSTFTCQCVKSAIVIQTCMHFKEKLAFTGHKQKNVLPWLTCWADAIMSKKSCEHKSDVSFSCSAEGEQRGRRDV